VLDFCAGGGGKALALAAMGAAVTAHDADALAHGRPAGPRAARRRESPSRRPGSVAGLPPFDLVLVDAPCSGSGAWRRQPEAKWRLDAARLAALMATQDAVLDAAARLCGRRAARLCDLLAPRAENGDRQRAFLAASSRLAPRRRAPADAARRRGRLLPCGPRAGLSFPEDNL
jgi:16S rRNA (cytosine967-C5)-methyltransferase